MRIRLAPEVVSKHPGYRRYCLVARGIDNRRETAALARELQDAAARIRSELELAGDAEHPRLASWRRAFEDQGLDADATPPSICRLARLARGGGLGEPVAFHSPIVAIANLVSLRHLVPCGADDLGLVRGDLALRPAGGHELFVALDSNLAERPEPGEWILADERRALCRRWVSQQGVHTSVAAESADVLLSIDVLPPVTRADGDRIASEAAGLVERFCGGEVTIHQVGADSPETDVETPRFRGTESVYDVLEERGYIQQTSSREAVRDLLARKITIYQGFDPTQPSLHVAHLMSLMVFHYLQQAGHRMIFILGGGTARVGDPSGRAEGRPLIDLETLAANGKAIQAQVQEMGLVDFDPASTPPGTAVASMIDNLEWLRTDLLDFAREITRHFSVNEMVKRDDFRNRLAANEPLSLLELLYTTLQGYDFLHLFETYDCLLQMGGNDQWINILDGTDLIRRKHGKTAHAMTFPLLMDRAGQKMGKTAKGETIWLAAEGDKQTSVFDFYQYWVNCPDEDLRRNFRLFTFLPLAEIEEILAGHPRAAQHRLAAEVTKIVHGEEAARRLREDAGRAFQGTRLPREAPVVEVTDPELAAGLPLIDALVQAGIGSRSEARRRIQQGGVRINGERVGGEEIDRRIGPDDLNDFDGRQAAVLRFGKGRLATVLRVAE
ncbi:MAG: tyrosine--tRNA ligase [Acidobacteriota bacterium]|nr:tyrosine--tRNA ligase [Acidobacteriota bacterium]